MIRDCISGEIVLTRSLLSATHQDLVELFRSVQQILPIPIQAVVSDDQCSIRKAVSIALPEVSHGLYQAVCSAITNDGRPPLEASGLKFKDRLSAIEASLAKVGQKRGSLNR